MMNNFTYKKNTNPLESQLKLSGCFDSNFNPYKKDFNILDENSDDKTKLELINIEFTELELTKWFDLILILIHAK